MILDEIRTWDAIDSVNKNDIVEILRHMASHIYATFAITSDPEQEIKASHTKLHSPLAMVRLLLLKGSKEATNIIKNGVSNISYIHHSILMKVINMLILKNDVSLYATFVIPMLKRSNEYH